MKKLAMLAAISTMLVAGSAGAQILPPPPTPDPIGTISTVEQTDYGTIHQQATEWSNYEQDTTTQWGNALDQWSKTSPDQWLINDVLGCTNLCDTGNYPTDTANALSGMAFGNAGYLGSQGSAYTNYVEGPGYDYANSTALGAFGYGVATFNHNLTEVEQNVEGAPGIIGGDINSAFQNYINPGLVIADTNANTQILEAGSLVGTAMSQEIGAVDLTLQTLGGALGTVDPLLQGQISAENAYLFGTLAPEIITDYNQLLFGGGSIPDGGVVGVNAQAIGDAGTGTSNLLNQDIPGALSNYENALTKTASSLYLALSSFQQELGQVEQFIQYEYGPDGLGLSGIPGMSTVLDTYDTTVIPTVNNTITDMEGFGDIVFHDSFQVANDFPNNTAADAYNTYLDLRDWEAAQQGCLTSGQCDDPYPGTVMNGYSPSPSSNAPNASHSPIVIEAGVLQ